MNPRALTCTAVLLLLPACGGWYDEPGYGMAPPQTHPAEPAEATRRASIRDASPSAGAQTRAVAPNVVPAGQTPPAPTPPASSATLEVREDEFTGHTHFIASSEGGRLHVTLIVDEEGLGGILSFSTYGDRWQYLRCHHLDMLADGEVVALPEEEHDGRVLERGVSEHVSVRLHRGALTQILMAGEVRARICGDVQTFTPDLIGVFRQIAERIGIAAELDGEAETATAEEP